MQTCDNFFRSFTDDIVGEYWRLQLLLWKARSRWHHCRFSQSDAQCDVSIGIYRATASFFCRCQISRRRMSSMLQFLIAKRWRCSTMRSQANADAQSVLRAYTFKANTSTEVRGSMQWVWQNSMYEATLHGCVSLTLSQVMRLEMLEWWKHLQLIESWNGQVNSQSCNRWKFGVHWTKLDCLAVSLAHRDRVKPKCWGIILGLNKTYLRSQSCNCIMTCLKQAWHTLAAEWILVVTFAFLVERTCSWRLICKVAIDVLESLRITKVRGSFLEVGLLVTVGKRGMKLDKGYWWIEKATLH